MIDSDGYIFLNKRSMKPYLVEIKTANPTLKRQLLHIFATLKMDTTEFIAKSYEGSYSVKTCYRIHILKKGIQQHQHHLISVKLNICYSGSGGVGRFELPSREPKSRSLDQASRRPPILWFISFLDMRFSFLSDCLFYIFGV